MEQEQSKTYTLKEAGELLNLTPQTVRLHIKQGKLNASLIGNKYFITDEAIKAYLEQREAESRERLERVRAFYQSQEAERKKKRHERYLRAKEQSKSKERKEL